MKTLLLLGILLAFLKGQAAIALATEEMERAHIKVRLLSANAVLGGDDVNYLGLELSPEKGWHVYWQNPGDSGMPPRIRFSTVDGLQFGEPLWPAPHKIPFGPLTNYGYEKIVLPIPLTLESKQETTLTISARASWLVCKELCVPGKATFVLKVPVAGEAKESPEASIIKQALASVPKALPLLGGSAEVSEGGDVVIQLYSQQPVFRTAETVEFFPLNEQLLDASAQAGIHWKQNVLSIKQQKSAEFVGMPKKIAGVLVVNGEKFWAFEFAP